MTHWSALGLDAPKDKNLQYFVVGNLATLL